MKMAFNVYRSVQEAFIHKDDIIMAEFSDLVKIIEERTELLEYKEQGYLFNFCSYKKHDYEQPKWIGNETRSRSDCIRRCKANVEKIYCLLLDVDGTMNMLQAMEVWNEYEYLLYTTFSHSAARDKFRMVIPLEQPLTRVEFDERHEAMCNAFKVDGASFTISQAFYFPSYSKDNAADRIFYWHRSEQRYNALELQAVTKKTVASQRIELNPILRSADINADLVYQSVLSGSGLRYSDTLPLATIMKSKGLTFPHFQNAINVVAAQDSTLRTDGADLKKLWDAAYNRITHKRATAVLQKLGCTKMPWRV